MKQVKMNVEQTKFEGVSEKERKMRHRKFEGCIAAIASVVSGALTVAVNVAAGEKPFKDVGKAVAETFVLDMAGFHIVDGIMEFITKD